MGNYLCSITEKDSFESCFVPDDEHKLFKQQVEQLVGKKKNLRFFSAEGLSVEETQRLISEEDPSKATIYKFGWGLICNSKAASQFHWSISNRTRSRQRQGQVKIVRFTPIIPRPMQERPLLESFFPTLPFRVHAEKFKEKIDETRLETRGGFLDVECEEPATEDTTLNFLDISCEEHESLVTEEMVKNWDPTNPEHSAAYHQINLELLLKSRKASSRTWVVPCDVLDWESWEEKHRNKEEPLGKRKQDMFEDFPIGGMITPDEALAIITNRCLEVHDGTFKYDKVVLQLSFKITDTDKYSHANAFVIDLVKREGILFEPHEDGWINRPPTSAIYIANGLCLNKLYRVTGTQGENPTCAIHSVMFAHKVVKYKLPLMDETTMKQAIEIPRVPPKEPLVFLLQAREIPVEEPVAGTSSSSS